MIIYIATLSAQHNAVVDICCRSGLLVAVELSRRFRESLAAIYIDLSVVI